MINKEKNQIYNSSQFEEISSSPLPVDISAGTNITNRRPNANFRIRLMAYLIDKTIIFIIDLFLLLGIVILIALTEGDLSSFLFDPQWIDSFKIKFSILILPLYLTFFIIKISYFTYFIGTTGQTLGKMFVNIKVVSSNNDDVTYSKAALRYIGYIASSFPLWLGFIWAIFDKKKEAWHDKIAGTYVINTKY